MLKKYFFLLMCFVFNFGLNGLVQAEPDYEIQVDGKNSWPPQGPFCQEFVVCCDAAKLKEPSSQLFCRLTAAKQPLDCKEATKSIGQFLKEKGVEVPKECLVQ